MERTSLTRPASLSNVLDQLDTLEDGDTRAATHKADQSALKRLEKKGYTKEERKRLRGLIKTAKRVRALYRHVTGEAAFGGHGVLAVLAKIIFAEVPALRSLCPAATPALEALLARMLAKDPATRPADGAEVAAAVQAVINGGLTSPMIRAPRSALTQSGQRLLCVVLAAGEPSAERALMPTLSPEELTRERAALQVVASKYGAIHP